MRAGATLLGLLAVATLGCSRPHIVLLRGTQGTTRDVFEAHGLDRAFLDSPQAQTQDWGAVFQVRVEDEASGDPGDRPPVLGTARVEGSVLKLEPRFPIEPGLTYRAVLLPGPWMAQPSPPVVQSFAIAARSLPPRTQVVAVYPSAAALPENQLKFYLCFSAAMRRGEAYSRIRLIEAGGTEVVAPFLEIGEELWDPSGTRLTLFFDPARIKRGLLPHEEAGSCLSAGTHYALVIDADWLDADGAPLKNGHRKEFFVREPDYDSPDPGTWILHTPTAQTREALRLEFPEPLDHALLQRLLSVRNAAGEVQPGQILVGKDELAWSLTPARAWQPGAYKLVIEKTLEDLAGNSVGRPFEVDVSRSVESRIEPESQEVPFEIK